MGKKIKTLREEKNMTQEELAFLSNLSQGYISMLEEGSRNNPGAKAVSDIAKALGVPVSYLL